MQSRNLIQLVNDIGTAYLQKHPKKSLLHSNQAIAQKLASYAPASFSEQEVEQFLIERYVELSEFGGTLARAIQQFFYVELGKNLEKHLLAQRISKNIIQQIGLQYLADHPQQSHWYSLFPHNNQRQAEMLRDCVLINANTRQPILEPNFKQLWSFLINVYATLASRGQLAKSIESLIENVFAITLIKMTTSGDGVYHYSPYLISDEMQRKTQDLFNVIEKNMPLRESSACAHKSLK